MLPGFLRTNPIQSQPLVGIRYLGGSNFMAKKEVARRFVEKVRSDDEKLDELLKWVAYDWGCEMDSAELFTTVEEWGTSAAIEDRGEYAF